MSTIRNTLPEAVGPDPRRVGGAMLDLLRQPSDPVAACANSRRPASSGAMLTAPICSSQSSSSGSTQLPLDESPLLRIEPRVSIRSRARPPLPISLRGPAASVTILRAAGIGYACGIPLQGHALLSMADPPDSQPIRGMAVSGVLHPRCPMSADL